MRYYERRSQKAGIAYWIALLNVLAFVGTFAWHRFFDLPTPLALKIFYATVLLSGVTLTLAAAALVNIWNEGCQGAGKAGFALMLSLCQLAIPFALLPNLLYLPRIYEVTTDPANPPAFDRIAKIRQGQANPAHYEADFAPLQAAAYPDIKPLVLGRPPADVYSAVREAVKVLNWKVVVEQAPDATKKGYIEAIDRTWLFGLTDDVVIRVSGSLTAAKIDVRSSSRLASTISAATQTASGNSSPRSRSAWRGSNAPNGWNV